MGVKQENGRKRKTAYIAVQQPIDGWCCRANTTLKSWTRQSGQFRAQMKVRHLAYRDKLFNGGEPRGNETVAYILGDRMLQHRMLRKPSPFAI